MTTITIEELRKLAAAGTVSLPVRESPGRVGAIEAPSDHPDSDSAARVAELLKTVRDLTSRRSPEQTGELERWLEERED